MVFIDVDRVLTDDVPLMTNLVVVAARRVLVEDASVVTDSERLNVVGSPAEVKFVCGKRDVTVEELTDVLIATVVKDVDVE